MNSQTGSIRETLSRQEPLATARGRILGQILLCEGCCCGRTDKGFPPVPRDWIKRQWKGEKLNKSVQLTISGCLGPCDLANVVCVVSPRGMQWFGGLQEQRQYDLLLDWAKASRAAGVLLEVPAELNRRRFERFDRGRTVQNIPFSWALAAGTSCSTSQCSTIFPASSRRKMSIPAYSRPPG